MNWQELKHALLELFENFSLPFNELSDNRQHNLHTTALQVDKLPRK